MSQAEHRLRVLRMIESGQVSAEEGARLLDVMAEPREPGPIRQQARTLRVRVTDLPSNRPKLNVTVPVSLIGVGAKLGARFLPRSNAETLEKLQQRIEGGATGRVYEMLDLEAGERIEIFVE